MKINWRKLWNPGNIDFVRVRKMDDEQRNQYLAEVKDGMNAKLWVDYAWLFNYLCMTNSWQYILVVWMMR